jgi:SAM-dependent methyltransferase
MSTVCPYCGGTTDPLVASTDRNRGTTSQVFFYWKCKACSLVFMDPIPEDLQPFYEGGYSRIPASLAELRELAAPERYRLDALLPYKTAGRLLEIGPWIGKFSVNAMDAGFDVTVLEMDGRCVDFMNRETGIRAIQSSDPAESLNAMKETFDVIALWHCLEHLRNPWELIRLAAARLEPGGVLLIAMPNIESYEFGLFGAGWRNLDAPRHLCFFPAPLLVRMGRELGLEPVLVTTTDALSDAFSLDTWLHFSLSVADIRYLRGILRLGGKYLANRRERRENSGPGLTVCLRRPPAPADGPPVQP